MPFFQLSDQCCERTIQLSWVQSNMNANRIAADHAERSDQKGISLGSSHISLVMSSLESNQWTHVSPPLTNNPSQSRNLVRFDADKKPLGFTPRKAADV